MSTVKLSVLEISMLNKANENLCLVFTNEIRNMNRGNKLLAMGLVYQKHLDNGELGGSPLIEFLITDAGRAYLTALEPIEPDAPTDATLGDALYERAEAVEAQEEEAQTVPTHRGSIEWMRAVQIEDIMKSTDMRSLIQEGKRLDAVRFYRQSRNDFYEAKALVDTAISYSNDARIAQLEAELAQAKARLTQIDAAYDKCAALAETTYLGTQEYERQWGMRLEQLFTTVATSQESHS